MYQILLYYLIENKLLRFFEEKTNLKKNKRTLIIQLIIMKENLNQVKKRKKTCSNFNSNIILYKKLYKCIF
jgi:hypothetical protein